MKVNVTQVIVTIVRGVAEEDYVGMRGRQEAVLDRIRVLGKNNQQGQCGSCQEALGLITTRIIAG
jgi:hypothetical protein